LPAYTAGPADTAAPNAFALVNPLHAIYGPSAPSRPDTAEELRFRLSAGYRG
jgi:hypothetical protein